MDFFRRQNWDIVAKTPYWFGLSAIVIVVGLVVLFTSGLNLGIDFTGGSLFTFEFERDITGPDQDDGATIAKVRAGLQSADLQSSQLQIGGTRQVLIRTAALTDEARRAHEQTIQEALGVALGDRGGALSLVGTDFVGPVVGADLQRSALWALFLGSILIVLYITLRYEFRFAVAGWAALLHDVLILVGAMALLRVELNSPFVAVVLTVLGYSINDSVIIFDRIRENMRLHRGAVFANTVNASILQTMARSINTLVTTLFPLIALSLLGGQTIRGFAVALIIGMVSGCYSSIFIAAPVVVAWEGRKARQRAQAVAVAPATQPRRRPQRPAEPAMVQEPEAEATDSAVATMQRAQDAAQEEKRAARRERRKKKKTQKKPTKGRKKRF